MKTIIIPLRKQAGFSLVEILIGMLIFAIGILGVIGMQVQSIRTNSYAYSLTEASNVARAKMEALMRLEPNDPALVDRTADGEAGLDNRGVDADGTENQGRYTVSWNVAEVELPAGTTTVHVNKVQVIATWMQGSTEKRVFFNSILGEK